MKKLRKIVAGYLRRQRSDHTLQPTALINEAYLRLVKQESATFDDRSHFYAPAARLMRHILVDAARFRNAEKRGADRMCNSIPRGWGCAIPPWICWQCTKLDKLQSHNQRLAQAVELRYFGGLQLEEIGGVLAVSLATVKRDLALGEAWLRRALSTAG